MKKSDYNTTLIKSDPFEFEKLVDKYNRTQWMHNYWHHSLYWSLLYVITIFGIRRLMKNRNALELKKPLIIWNSALAVFSICGTVRTLPILVQVIRKLGFFYSVCFVEPILENIQPSVFWGWLFVCSKLVEFGDTIFIVLRKKKLIFLHWYHHIVTLIFCWYLGCHQVGIMHWFCVMNYFVHSFMYTYFALMTVGMKIPRIVAVCITFVQLLQMIIAVFVSTWASWRRWNGFDCDFPNTVIVISLAIYISYVYLFSRLFYFSYIAKSSKKLKDL